MAQTAQHDDSRTGTRDRVLDAAEQLFVEHGFSATSLRAIAAQAQVNLAATHYHFGSKLGLLAEVFHRRIAPIDEARIAALDELQARVERPDVQALVRAYLTPLYALNRYGGSIQVIPALIGRIHSEPEAISKPLLEAEFSKTAQRFTDALCGALPRMSKADIRWRFHFMIGAMLQLIRFSAPIGGQLDTENFAKSLDRLVSFVVGGITQTSDYSITEANT
jgi:AcrR family transcriptional regulator